MACGTSREIYNSCTPKKCFSGAKTPHKALAWDLYSRDPAQGGFWQGYNLTRERLRGDHKLSVKGEATTLQ